MRKIVIIFTLMLCANMSFGYLFINTVPMKAAVYLDDVYLGVSPLIVKDEVRGNHQLRFVKEGYFESNVKINIKDPVTNIYTFLTPRTFSLYIPNQSAINLNNQWYENDYIHNLPDGFYRFESGTNYVMISRENPNLKFLWFGLALAGAGLVEGIVGSIQANDFYNKFMEANNAEDAISYMNKAMFWDNFGALGYILAGAGAATSVVFAIDTAKFNVQNRHINIDSDEFTATDTSIYNKAMDFYTTGSMNEATAMFTRLIKDFNDSRYTPIALFRRAGIYQSQNRMGEAIADLEMIKTVYPIYEIYAFTLKNLGDIYYAQTLYEQAIANYEEVIGLNESARSEMEYWIVKSYFEWAKLAGDAGIRQKFTEARDRYVGQAEYPSDYKNELKQLNF